MWHIKILQSLTKKIKKSERANANRIIDTTHATIYKNNTKLNCDTPCALQDELIFGLVEQMLAKYYDKPDDSITAKQFTQDLISLTIIYSKYSYDSSVDVYSYYFYPLIKDPTVDQQLQFPKSIVLPNKLDPDSKKVYRKLHADYLQQNSSLPSIISQLEKSPPSDPHIAEYLKYCQISFTKYVNKLETMQLIKLDYNLHLGELTHLQKYIIDNKELSLAKELTKFYDPQLLDNSDFGCFLRLLDSRHLLFTKHLLLTTPSTEVCLTQKQDPYKERSSSDKLFLPFFMAQEKAQKTRELMSTMQHTNGSSTTPMEF